MKTIFTGALVLLMGWTTTAIGREQPNIIFILADDLGWGDLSCYGQTRFETPNLDRMAADGLRFTAHYAGSTVCAPSRSSLLTGRDQGHAYTRGNGTGESSMPPGDRLPNVAWMLRELGYRTAQFGKSSTAGSTYNRFQPNEFGFDHHFGYLTHRDAHRHYPENLWLNGERVYFNRNHYVSGRDYAEDVVVDALLEWVEANREDPFFIHLNLAVPHADLTVPADSLAQFSGRFEETPYRPKEHHYAWVDEPKATFAAMVTRMDQHVGMLLDHLVELGLDSDTLVLFSSDNGPHREGGHHPEALDSNGPWRGGKRDLYEGGIRVPLVAWWPGTIAPGRVSDHVSAFWDFLPTAMEVAGRPLSDQFATEGLSYAPLLKGSGEQATHEALYWEFHEQGGKQAVRFDDWKGVRLDVQKDPGGPIELYNLDDDPGETVDVASEYPEIVARMESVMAERTPCWYPRWNFVRSATR
jgi:arylsulfatase A-like enzyme